MGVSRISFDEAFDLGATGGGELKPGMDPRRHSAAPKLPRRKSDSANSTLRLDVPV